MTTLKETSRQEWVDIARGYGIVLVVIGHACGGLIDSSLSGKPSLLYQIFFYIYSFHMPLFFFLAGLFVINRLKNNRRKFLDGAFTKVLKPYFIWSVIQVTIIFLMSPFVNAPISEPLWQVYISILWSPPSQFWFLYVLFLLQLLSFLILPRTGAFVLLAMLIALRFIIMHIPINLGPIIGFTAMNGVYFALGMVLGPRLTNAQAFGKATFLLMILSFSAWAVSTWGAYAFTQNQYGQDFLLTMKAAQIANIKSPPIYLLPAFLGTAMILYLSNLNHFTLGKILIYLGQSSMPIFLIHVICVSGTRILLLKLIPDINIFILLTIISISGILLPLAAFETAKKLKIASPLGLN